MGRGVLDTAPTTTVKVVPIADGREGAFAAIAAARPTLMVAVDSVDAIGRPTRSAYAVLTDDPDGSAVLEAARTIGMLLALGLGSATNKADCWTLLPARCGPSGHWMPTHLRTCRASRWTLT